ncbi:uncharacterized protein LOC117169705 [Belonocnema kinseyi]|uniref:uncharacterized protein LOC117169705 n=1 Tax=Belonocnema kinseyi TaxID=2817044 RepID=UPI00143D164D|nr:uncharacterized protein LOC117169705 [Belonocnema kinseyi]
MSSESEGKKNRFNFSEGRKVVHPQTARRRNSELNIVLNAEILKFTNDASRYRMDEGGKTSENPGDLSTNTEIQNQSLILESPSPSSCLQEEVGLTETSQFPFTSKGNEKTKPITNAPRITVDVNVFIDRQQTFRSALQSFSE